MRNMLSKALTMAALAGAVTLAGTSTVQAAPIVGQLNIAGGSVRVSATTIEWLPSGGGFGQVTTTPVVPADAGYFSGVFNSGLGSPYLAYSQDLALPFAEVPGFLYNFTAPGYDQLSFTLTGIVAPTAPACTGAEANEISCSFGLFTLKNTAEGAVVNFGVLGFFLDPSYEGPDGPLNTARGNYSSQLPPTTRIADIMATIGGGGSITNSYSGTFVAVDATVPEPATLAMFGMGLLGVGLLHRRRMRNAAK